MLTFFICTVNQNLFTVCLVLRILNSKRKYIYYCIPKVQFMEDVIFQNQCRNQILAFFNTTMSETFVKEDVSFVFVSWTFMSGETHGIDNPELRLFNQISDIFAKK